MKLISDDDICAIWGAHPTTGNTLIYKQVAKAQLKADAQWLYRELSEILISDKDYNKLIAHLKEIIEGEK